MRGFVGVPKASLERLVEGLRAGRLQSPISESGLVAFGLKENLEQILSVLEGHSREACLSVLDAALAERTMVEGGSIEFVYSGPERSETARSTAIVLKNLFRSANKSVILAGYAFTHGEEILRPLYEAVAERGVVAHLFVHVDQPEWPSADPEAYGFQRMRRFLTSNWSFGEPFPRVYCDRRALVPGPPYCSLHAKCVVVDGAQVFLSSANFTDRGQERNIEAGVSVNDKSFAREVEVQFLRLIERNEVLRLSD